jgi:hypothetical protein
MLFGPLPPIVILCVTHKPHMDEDYHLDVPATPSSHSTLSRGIQQVLNECFLQTAYQ